MVRMGAALLLVAVAAAVAGLAAANFRDDCDLPWEPQNAKFTSDGNGLSMSLVSNSSGTVLNHIACCDSSLTFFNVSLIYDEHNYSMQNA